MKYLKTKFLVLQLSLLSASPFLYAQCFVLVDEPTEFCLSDPSEHGEFKRMVVRDLRTGQMLANIIERVERDVERCSSCLAEFSEQLGESEEKESLASRLLWGHTSVSPIVMSGHTDGQSEFGRLRVGEGSYSYTSP